MNNQRAGLIIAAAALAVCFTAPGTATAQSHASVVRPPIVGLAHVGLYVKDISQADEFYGHVLGFSHFSLDKPSGGLFLNYYKINDRQYIEIYPGLKDDSQDRLSHVAFETTNIRQLRDYLASKGVEVPSSLKTGLDKNLSFTVSDPENRRIEFVQYMPGSLHSTKFGKLMPDTRISDHMIHAGFIVHDRAAEDRFYKEILGFKVMWYGGMKDNVVNWVDMRVPDGNDWIEYMLNVNNPSVRTRGVMNHFALGVKQIQPPYRSILSRGYKPPEPPKIGRDGKWQLNLYDPNLTRVEVMELKPAQTPCCSPMILK
ncbi:MAG TPA: VOC family protein [Bryobacteraceae bacterium]|jgi:catechol 2,3-dioxygenase-like lactoylglutathione lyase family enzyme|nr:VOC family protein [Bryobacteraceae bacterium]